MSAVQYFLFLHWFNGFVLEFCIWSCNSSSFYSYLSLAGIKGLSGTTRYTRPSSKYIISYCVYWVRCVNGDNLFYRVQLVISECTDFTRLISDRDSYILSNPTSFIRTRNSNSKFSFQSQRIMPLATINITTQLSSTQRPFELAGVGFSFHKVNNVQQIERTRLDRTQQDSNRWSKNARPCSSNIRIWFFL